MVLVLVVILLAVLAVRLHLANRSHREAAQGALRHHAVTAAWQLTNQVELELERTLLSAVRRGALRSGILPFHEGERQPDVDAFGEGVDQELALAGLAGVAEGFLIVDPSSEATWSTGAPELVAQEAARAVRADILGAAERHPQRTMRRIRIEGGDSTAVEVLGLDRIITAEALGAKRTIAYGVLHEPRGGRPQVYAVLVDAPAAAGQLARQVVAANPLLPEGLTGGLPNRAALSIRVETAAGEVVFASSGGAMASTSVTDTLRPPFQDTRVTVGIRPDVADLLVVGGVPPSGLPLLALLMVTGAGLATVGVVQLRRHRQLARLRSDFVAGVSHELRTPLSQIRLFADLLTQDGLNAGERFRSLQIIGEEATRLGFLVDNLLSFSRRTPVPALSDADVQDLAAVAREAAEAFAPLAVTAGSTVRVHTPKGPVPVRAKRHALTQVLLNLLDNAVKYGPRGQTVNVRVRVDEDSATVEVEDEGPGIPLEQRRRVFDPYHRLERDVNRGIGGSGIGLALVERLAAEHGGRVRVEDSRTGGACVAVELPLVGGRVPKGATVEAG